MSSRDNLIPSIGDVLMGRYRIESFVARGGMGVVMRARQLSMDREVAIKMILPQYADNDKTLARFDREVHLAKQLRHPNIVELYDYGSTEAGVLYLVMEFLEGEDLKLLLRRDGPMPVGRAGKIAMQVLDALAEAHSQNIVHRDLKPSNIFVTRMRRLGDFAKLLDFGIAKSLAEDASEVTAQGEICGTSSYMAPEMFVQGAVGTTVDVYAMGLILLEMLLGKKVFRGQSSAETLVLHLRKDVVIPPPFAATNLSHVLTKALAKHPRHRYDNAIEFLEDLEPALDSLDGSMRIAAETIEKYSQDLSEDGGLLDQVLAGPWASGMTEPESGSSDIVVMPGAASDEPEEFEAAVTQLIERAKGDFAREESDDEIARSTTPRSDRPTIPEPREEADEDERGVGKETMKMTAQSFPEATVELDESDMLAVDEGLDDETTDGDESETDGREFAATRKMAEVPTGTMTAIASKRPWWRTRAALVVFALCCVALFSVAVLVPLLTSGVDSKPTTERVVEESTRAPAKSPPPSIEPERSAESEEATPDEETGDPQLGDPQLGDQDSTDGVAARPSAAGKPTPDEVEEAPKKAPATTRDAPKKDAPKEDAPKKDAPKKDAPKEDAPKEDAPKEDAPKKKPSADRPHDSKETSGGRDAPKEKPGKPVIEVPKFD